MGCCDSKPDVYAVKPQLPQLQLARDCHTLSTDRTTVSPSSVAPQTANSGRSELAANEVELIDTLRKEGVSPATLLPAVPALGRLGNRVFIVLAENQSEEDGVLFEGCIPRKTFEWIQNRVVLGLPVIFGPGNPPRYEWTRVICKIIDDPMAMLTSGALSWTDRLEDMDLVTWHLPVILE
jgi:hypothetical protein